MCRYYDNKKRGNDNHPHAHVILSTPPPNPAFFDLRFLSSPLHGSCPHSRTDSYSHRRLPQPAVRPRQARPVLRLAFLISVFMILFTTSYVVVDMSSKDWIFLVLWLCGLGKLVIFVCSFIGCEGVFFFMLWVDPC